MTLKEFNEKVEEVAFLLFNIMVVILFTIIIVLALALLVALLAHAFRGTR